MEEVRELSVRQVCLKSPRSPQITLCPCFCFSPSCNKIAQMLGIFLLFLSLLQPVSFQPKYWGVSGPPRALCCVGSLPRHVHASLPSAPSQCKTFLALAPCETPTLSGGITTCPPPRLPPAPSPALLSHHKGATAALSFGRFPSSSNLVTHFLGLQYPLSSSPPGPRECLQIFFAL